MQSKTAKRNMLLGIVFGILAVFFFCMYYFDVIKSMDKLLSAIYVVYFLGLALVYNGAYCKEKELKLSKALFYLLGVIMICISVALLVYGYVKGEISFFN